MAEKRLAFDQVPFTSGGGGASILQSTTKERTGGPDTTGSTAFVPVGGAGATLISFTLQNDSSVFLAAYGTAIPDSGFETQIGIRVDGTDYTGTSQMFQDPDLLALEQGGVTCSLGIGLAAGPHTAEIVFRTGVAQTAKLSSSPAKPTRISAIWMDPVYGVGSMTKLQAVLANAVPPFTYSHPNGITPYSSFAPVPGTQISFSLTTAQDVYFSTYGTSDYAFGAWKNLQIGIRVDGTDYPGTGFVNPDPNTAYPGVCAMQALSLGAGAHLAEVVIRTMVAIGGHIPTIYISATYPLVLNVLLTKPEQLYQAETITNPAQIDAGDAGSPGAALKVSLSDHQHPVNTATLNTDIQPTGTANNAGVSSKLPRADHVHRLLLEGQEEGVAVASRPKINFIGADVTVTDNVGSDRLDVTFTSPASDYVGKFEQGTKPTIVQIPDGKWGFWWDTSLSEMWQVRNRGGTMYAVELNPLP